MLNIPKINVVPSPPWRDEPMNEVSQGESDKELKTPPEGCSYESGVIWLESSIPEISPFTSHQIVDYFLDMEGRLKVNLP
jgi:hypothetical protein